jgi:hypothetical protein
MLFEKTFEMEEAYLDTSGRHVEPGRQLSPQSGAWLGISLKDILEDSELSAGSALAVLDFIRMERGVVGAINVGRYRRKRLHERASGIVDPG